MAKSTVANRFELKVNTMKTKVQCIGREKQPLNVVLRGTELYHCAEFVYVGGVYSQDGQKIRISSWHSEESPEHMEGKRTYGRQVTNVILNQTGLG